MIKYGELHKALSTYTQHDIHENIPVDLYRRVMKACFRANNSGLSWDIQHATSILIYLAFNEGHIKPAQLNTNGLAALDYAEKLLAQLQNNKHPNVLNALKSA